MMTGVPSVLITGANRGIGFGLVREYLSEGWQVHACCRRPAQALDLAGLSLRSPTLRIHRVDLAKAEQIIQLGTALCGVSLQLLLNNAGSYGPRGTNLWTISAAEWQSVLTTNVIGTALITGVMLPLLSRDGGGMIVNISSWQGSLAANLSGRKYAYRTSKAGLNMLTRCLAADLREHRVGCVSIDPGWVKTRMGEPGAQIDAEESARRIRVLVARLTLTDSGSFLDSQGKAIPW